MLKIRPNSETLLRGYMGRNFLSSRRARRNTGREIRSSLKILATVCIGRIISFGLQMI